MRPPRDRDLLATREVAALLGLSDDTVTRRADAGRLPSVRTAGGHRRFRRSEVLARRDAMLAGELDELERAA